MLTDQTRERDRRTTVLAWFAIVAAVTLTVASCTAGPAQKEPPAGASSSAPDRPASSSTGSGPSRSGPPDVEDGVLPDHASAYDTSLPGIAKLDPALRKAVQDAETAMEEDGIRMQITTGWRSKKYQE